MSFSIKKIISAIVFSMAIAMLFHNPVMANTVNSSYRNTLDKAAQEVVKDTGVKEQFGKSENGNLLLDKASDKASEKLQNLSKKYDSETEIPDSKKIFFDNISGKS